MEGNLVSSTVTVSEETNVVSDSNGEDNYDILHSNGHFETSHLSARLSTQLKNRPNIYHVNNSTDRRQTRKSDDTGSDP
jgi:hypothetical protein